MENDNDIDSRETPKASARTYQFEVAFLFAASAVFALAGLWTVSVGMACLNTLVVAAMLLGLGFYVRSGKQNGTEKPAAD